MIYSEVRYTFRSTLSTFIVGGVQLQAQAYQRPRFSIEVARVD